MGLSLEESIEEVRTWLKYEEVDNLLDVVVRQGYDDLEAISECNSDEAEELANFFEDVSTRKAVKHLIKCLHDIGMEKYRDQDGFLNYKKNNAIPALTPEVNVPRTEELRAGYLSILHNNDWEDRFFRLDARSLKWFKSVQASSEDGCITLGSSTRLTREGPTYFRVHGMTATQTFGAQEPECDAWFKQIEEANNNAIQQGFGTNDPLAPHDQTPHGAPTHGSPTRGAPTRGAPTHGAPSRGAPLPGNQAQINAPTRGAQPHGMQPNHIAPNPLQTAPGQHGYAQSHTSPTASGYASFQPDHQSWQQNQSSGYVSPFGPDSIPGSPSRTSLITGNEGPDKPRETMQQRRERRYAQMLVKGENFKKYTNGKRPKHRKIHCTGSLNRIMWTDPKDNVCQGFVFSADLLEVEEEVTKGKDKPKFVIHTRTEILELEAQSLIARTDWIQAIKWLIRREEDLLLEKEKKQDDFVLKDTDRIPMQRRFKKQLQSGAIFTKLLSRGKSAVRNVRFKEDMSQIELVHVDKDKVVETMPISEVIEVVQDEDNKRLLRIRAVQRNLELEAHDQVTCYQWTEGIGAYIPIHQSDA